MTVIFIILALIAFVIFATGISFMNDREPTIALALMHLSFFICLLIYSLDYQLDNNYTHNQLLMNNDIETNISGYNAYKATHIKDKSWTQ